MMLWLGHMTFPFTSPWPLLQALGVTSKPHMLGLPETGVLTACLKKSTFPQIPALPEQTHWDPGSS